MRKIKVIVKRPGEKPASVWISDTLENLQRHVGGYIETVTIGNMVVICDEEGLLKNKPYCCSVGGYDFVGDVIFCGVDGVEFADLPISWHKMKQLYPQLWRD